MEYEYSFNVTDVLPYVDYCKNNNYELISETRQIRTIYRNNGNMARITQDIINDKKVFSLDFKEDKLEKNDLIVRKESKKIIFDNIESCEDILSFLDYKKDNTLDRKRLTYHLKNVTFEIDEYIEPCQGFVVAIEGKKNQVDKIYKELEELNSKYKV